MADVIKEDKKRDMDIDTVKGIAIILMVIGHCGPVFSRYIYLFHMAVFFIASGYCEYGKTLNAKEFVAKKIKSLWIPFAVYNGVFTLLNNLFCTIGIYSTDASILDIASGQQVSHIYSVQEMLRVFIKNIFFLNEPQMGGASWFLKTMFTVQIFYLVVYLMCKKSGRKIFAYFIALLYVVIAGFISSLSVDLPFRLHAFFAAYTTFSLGLFLKKWKMYESFYINKITPIISLALLLLMSNYGKIEMIDGKITNPIFFTVCSITGWSLLLSIARCSTVKIKRFFGFVNRFAIEILLLHFLAFKIITAIYILTTGSSWEMLALFPVIPVLGEKYWFLYTLVGVFFPVLFGIAMTKTRLALLLMIDKNFKRMKV